MRGGITFVPRAAGQDLLDSVQVRLVECDLCGGNIFLEPHGAAGARDRNDVAALGEQPGQCQLSDGARRTRRRFQRRAGRTKANVELDGTRRRAARDSVEDCAVSAADSPGAYVASWINAVPAATNKMCVREIVSR